MTDPTHPSGAPILLERTIPGPIEAVWYRWTTAPGLESWWSVEDLVFEVRALDLREGGALVFEYTYRPSAEDPRRASEFEAAGVPTSFRARGRFTRVEPPHRLAFVQVVEIGPGAQPHEARYDVTLDETRDGVSMRLSVEGAPTPHWRHLAKPNLDRQVDRLARVVGGTRPRPAHP